MKIETRYFGEVEFEEKDIIKFPTGIVGFIEYEKYILINFKSENYAMFCLQGIEEDSPVFIVFNPFEIIDDYQPQISDADMRELNCSDEDSLEYYVIANVTNPMENTVVNLKSPIVVNTENRLAKQVIMNRYDLRHKMFKKTEE